MKFMMLMIPAVYHGNMKLDNFIPPADMVEKMTKYNDELAKAGLLGELNGLHPLPKGSQPSSMAPL